jgi:hypothetical protein
VIRAIPSVVAAYTWDCFIELGASIAIVGLHAMEFGSLAEIQQIWVDSEIKHVHSGLHIVVEYQWSIPYMRLAGGQGHLASLFRESGASFEAAGSMKTKHPHGSASQWELLDADEDVKYTMMFGDAYVKQLIRCECIFAASSRVEATEVFEWMPPVSCLSLRDSAERCMGIGESLGVKFATIALEFGDAEKALAHAKSGLANDCYTMSKPHRVMHARACLATVLSQGE